MRILWDFRLFSLGYRERGVGAYTLAVAGAFSDMEISSEIFILGDEDSVPELTGLKKVRWIQYQCSDWKLDLIKIPLIIKRYKIDIFHYWIALGPLRQIGLGMFHPCTTVATIYDLGTENWDVPFLKSVKKSRYWQIQKELIRSIDKIICISEATSGEVKKMFPSLSQKMEVIYPVFSFNKERNDAERQKSFITLCGSVHKNAARVVKAFDLFRRKMPDYQLKILGR
jgi:glycosyltransferase involved in cell wall biosynthesis